jgi:hypothetical protein
MDDEDFHIAGNVSRTLLLIRPHGSPMVHVLGWAEGEGFHGRSLIVLPEVGAPSAPSLSDIATGLEKSGIEASPYSAVKKFFPETLFHASLFQDEWSGIIPNAFSSGQMEAIRGFIGERIPEASLEILRRFGAVDRGFDLVDRLQYLALGDVEARRQALISYPLHRSAIFNSDEALALIDARRPLGDWVAKHSGLDASQARVLGRIEKILGEAIAGDSGGEAVKSIRNRSVDDLGNARIAARSLRLDQVPDTVQGVIDLLDAHRQTLTLKTAFGVGETAFARLLRRSGPEDWAKVARGLSALPQGEIVDYLRAMSRAFTGAFHVHAFREAGVDLDRIARTAASIWEKSSVSKEDAAHLSAYLEDLEKGLYRVGSQNPSTAFRMAIDPHMSLKNLREFQERWHHVRATLDNRTLAASEPIAWDPLVGALDLADGVVAREISDSAGLELQGRRERHCVGGYAAAILSARPQQSTLIFSIEKEGCILSTVEISVSLHRSRTESTASWSIVQNKAACNDDPRPPAKRAAARLLERLKEIPVEDVSAYVTGVAANSGNLKDRLSKIVVHHGGNVANPGLPETVLETYAEILPKALRDLSIEDWVARIDAVDPEVLRGIRKMAAALARKLAALDPSEAASCDLEEAFSP